VSELAGSIDELERDLLEGQSAGLSNEGLSKSDGASLNSGASSLDHDVILGDNSVSDESSQGVDGLAGQIELGRSIVLLSSLSNLVDLLVDFSSVMESVLSSSSNSEGNSGRMPSSDTGDLTKSLVSLSGKSSSTPSRSHSGESVTLGGGEGIKHLVLSEDSINGNLLLEKSISEVNLLFNGSSVNLNLEEMGLALSKSNLSDLSVSENSNDGGSSLQSVEVLLNEVLVVSVHLDVLGEGFLLRLVPVLVESSLQIVAQMVSPDGGESSKSSGGGDVSNDSNNDHGGSLDDGDSLDDFLLVNLRSELVYLSNDVSRSSLVSQKGSKMNGLRCIIARELSNFASIMFGSLSR